MEPQNLSQGYSANKWTYSPPHSLFSTLYSGSFTQMAFIMMGQISTSCESHWSNLSSSYFFSQHHSTQRIMPFLKLFYCLFVCFFVYLGSHDTRFFRFSSYPNNYFSVWLVGSTCSARPPDNVALLGLGIRPSSSPSKLSYWMISLVTLLLSTIYKITQLTFIFQALISPLTFISTNVSSYVSTRHFNLYQYLSILLDSVLRSAMLLPKPSLSSPKL